MSFGRVPNAPTSVGRRFWLRKRIVTSFALAACLLATVALCGCGGNDQSSQKESQTATSSAAAASIKTGVLGLAAEKAQSGDSGGAKTNAADGAMGAGSGGTGSNAWTASAGRWDLPDGSGGLVIGDGPSVTFVDPSGGQIATFQGEPAGVGVSLRLNRAELAQVFGGDVGTESILFTFTPRSETELVMYVTDEATGAQQAIILTRASATPTPTTVGGSKEAQAKANADLLAQACLAYAYKYGRKPTTTDVGPSGGIAEFLTQWPTNPYTGGPMKYGEKNQIIGNYIVESIPNSVMGDWAKRITVYLSEDWRYGPNYMVVVPYDQVGLEMP